MKDIWLDTPEMRVSREKLGDFIITLKANQLLKKANMVQSHHFARVLAAMKKLNLSNSGQALRSAIEDFAAAVLADKNYFIRRMYFYTQPEMIARWYMQPAYATVSV
ncbi:hypothetical protein P886_4234 [Alteromonadaceae bacterium 2753L.S.0a.02]|nr:hypothetical protein P886_4234 [Alteromonadaceae bacterium 2753L.S.0a.02]